MTEEIVRVSGRKSTVAAALAAAVTLIAGCGSGDGGAEKTYDVTLEAQDTGKTSIYYTLETNHFEQVTLPWKKSGKVTLKDAELKVGRTVSVVPGTVQDPDGTLRAGSCVIYVDGKKVSDNQNGKSNKGCEYKLK
ncbi:hypothetical protein ACFP1Z_16185 [Streptomyces gamaensis]|uniref:Lipoprotein n=1 Tax=Streptomyces gamaensis TaxID=1763542 RepID=A0ABW0Z0Y1_9ACTN